MQCSVALLMYFTLTHFHLSVYKYLSHCDNNSGAVFTCKEKGRMFSSLFQLTVGRSITQILKSHQLRGFWWTKPLVLLKGFEWKGLSLMNKIKLYRVWKMSEWDFNTKLRVIGQDAIHNPSATAVGNIFLFD